MDKSELIGILNKSISVNIQVDGDYCLLKIKIDEDKADDLWFDKVQSAIYLLSEIYLKNSILIIDRKLTGNGHVLGFEFEDNNSETIKIGGLSFYYRSIGQIRLRGTYLNTSVTFDISFDDRPIKGILQFKSISYFEGA